MENKALPSLCGDKDCTGCASCAQSCRLNAIKMVFNSEGYYNPMVETDKCVGCLMCESHCPILHPLEKHKESPKAYAAWIKDEKVREDSSSGGIFSAIALSVFRDNGVVWGAGYGDNVHPVYKFIEREEALNQLRGSKYVQCEIKDAYKTIKKQLTAGRKVLFCGTPCHVAGLYAYLDKNLIENLLTVDFICHGVPSSMLFDNYINWLSDKYHDKVLDFRFRDSRFGVNYNIGTSVFFKNNGKKYLYLEDNSYTLGFCRDKSIHDACGSCRFNGIQRNSDFTIGDFHGAKGQYSARQQFRGISCLIVNSKKAIDVLELLNIKKEEVLLKNIVNDNPNYTRHVVSKKTLDLKKIIEMRYDDVQKEFFAPTLKDAIKVMTMRILGGKMTYLIRNVM